MVSAVVLINADGGRVNDVAQALVQLRGVSQVFSVAGHYDIVALLNVGENEELADLVSDGIRKIPGILNTQTLIAFRTYTPAEMAAAFSMGVED